MLRRHVSLSLAMLLAVLALSGHGGRVAAEVGTKTLILATAATPAQAAGQGILHFADLVKRRSNGRLVVQPHLSGSLYDEIPSIQAVVNGTLDIGSASNANMGSFTRALFWMDLPMLIHSESQMWKVLEGSVGEQMFGDLATNQHLTVLMALANGGFRQLLTTRKPVHAIGELKGFKIRTPGSPVELATWQTWGAIPTPVAWAETYTALSQGTVDGEGLQYTWAEAGKHTEVIKYATELNYSLPVLMVVIRTEKLNALSMDDRQILLQAAKSTQIWERKVDAHLNAQIKTEMISRGIQVYVPTAAQLAEWQDRAKQVWGRFGNEVKPELLTKIQAAK